MDSLKRSNWLIQLNNTGVSFHLSFLRVKHFGTCRLIESKKKRPRLCAELVPLAKIARSSRCHGLRALGFVRLTLKALPITYKSLKIIALDTKPSAVV
jgi:hypothetical protein